MMNEIKKKIEEYSDLKDLPAEELVSIAKELGKYFKYKGLKTTQIRKFLDGIRRIYVQANRGKTFDENSVILLKPKLAYAVGRQSNIRPLMEVLEPAITRGSKSYESFKKLLALVEGIVAYHKYYGGGE